MNAATAIVTDKQLGDTLLLEPAARHLAKSRGVPCALFTPLAFQPLVELMPGAVWGPEQPGPFDEVWVTSWSSRAVMEAWRLKARRRILLVSKAGHIRWWYRLMMQAIVLQHPAEDYWARYFWRQVSGLTAESFRAPQLNAPSANWRHPRLPNESYLLINPTAAWARKFWPVSHWAEVIRRMTARYHLPVVLCGGGSERERLHVGEIAQASGVETLNLAGETSLREYLHALSAARLVLCVDGAASHLAQAFQVPTVTLFGPTHELKWHWPTQQHIALAARHFNEARAFGPASDVPVSAMMDSVALLLA